MKFASLKFLSDENISPRVVSFLRHNGIDVIDAQEEGWQGKTDSYLLEKAYDDNRFVITHDSDFGTLAINEGSPCRGIIYLRLRNLKADSIINALEKLLLFDRDLLEGSLIVVEDTRVRIRSI